MRETYICEKCGTPFIRDRITARGCSARCKRWLYVHQGPSKAFVWGVPDQQPVQPQIAPEALEQRAARLKEGRRLAMRRYRARLRAGVVETDPLTQTYKEYQAAQAALPSREQACDNCHKLFIYDPASGMLPGCTQLCRRLIYKRQVMGP